MIANLKKYFFSVAAGFGVCITGYLVARLEPPKSNHLYLAMLAGAVVGVTCMLIGVAVQSIAKKRASDS